MARHLADLWIVECLEAAAVDDHGAVGSNRRLKNNRVDVNAFFLMAAAKTPMDGAGVIGAVIAALASERRHFRIVADADFTELANVIEIFCDHAAKHVGLFAAVDGNNAPLFHVAGHRFPGTPSRLPSRDKHRAQALTHRDE